MKLPQKGIFPHSSVISFTCYGLTSLTRSVVQSTATGQSPRPSSLFALTWSGYIFTGIIITWDELKTLPVGVEDLFHSAIVDWGRIMAAGMTITLPALLFFVAVQRYWIRG